MNRTEAVLAILLSLRFYVESIRKVFVQGSVVWASTCISIFTSSIKSQSWVWMISDGLYQLDWVWIFLFGLLAAVCQSDGLEVRSLFVCLSDSSLWVGFCEQDGIRLHCILPDILSLDLGSWVDFLACFFHLIINAIFILQMSVNVCVRCKSLSGHDDNTFNFSVDAC